VRRISFTCGMNPARRSARCSPLSAAS
jgi:hypothetical protein